MGTMLALIGFIALIYGIVVLIISFVKKRPKKKPTVILVAGFVALIAGGALIDATMTDKERAEMEARADEREKEREEKKAAAEAKKAEEAAKAKEKEEEEAKKKKEAEEATKAKEEEAKPKKEVKAKPTEKTLDDKVAEAVKDELGAKTNAKKKRIHKIEVHGDVVNVWLNANENLSAGMTKKGMWSDTFDLLEELAEFKEVNLYQFVWMLPLTDKYGKESDSKVMSMDFPREIINKIDFDNVDYNNAPDISENYWEHNALK